MSPVVSRRPAALDDLDRAAGFIQDRSGPDRAIRFLREAEATFAQLARMPGLGTTYEPAGPAAPGLRYFPINRHRKFLAFYRATPDGIEVLRVLHGARDIDQILGRDEVDPIQGDPTDES